MVLNIFKKITTSSTYCCSPLLNRTVRFYGIYEPPYLKNAKLKVPVYHVLNIQIQGYKYPLLEHYQSFITKMAKEFDITIQDSFAFPHKEYKIKKFKKGTSIAEAEYDLRIYERDIQIQNVSSTILPILTRILEAALPEGVSLCIDTYDPQLQKKREIPNKDLIDSKSELSEILEKKSK